MTKTNPKKNKTPKTDKIIRFLMMFGPNYSFKVSFIENPKYSLFGSGK